MYAAPIQRLITELAKLPGIGPSKAEAIVEFREKEPFVKAEDLRKVKGIGDKLFDSIKDQARVVSTRLAAGRTVVRAYGETSPGAGFEPVAPDLEDVYFCTIAGYLAPTAVAA